MFHFDKIFTIAAFIMFLLASFGGINNAEAQSRSCKILKNQLIALDNKSAGNSGGSKKYREYTDAIRKQQIEISKVSKIAKRNRCTSRGLFKNRSAQCKRMVSSLNKMQANLASLKKTRNKFAPAQTGNSRKRRAIIAKMERNGCSATNSRQASANEPRKSRRRTLIEQIFGVRTYRDNGSGNDWQEDSPRQYGGSTYRTLCVRKTDGYYFPISFSTTRDFFERDEQACINMCPGVNVGLYHHRMPSEDSESMVAFGSEFPYAKEKFAFAYRKAVDRSAQCNFALREDVFAANNNKSAKIGAIEHGLIVMPEFKTDRTYSPDDAEIILGNLSINKIKEMLIAANEPIPDPAIAREQDDRKIRIVGPAFYPVQ